MKTKSITLTNLINVLKEHESKYGKYKVFMSIDSEGNGANSIEETGEALLGIGKKSIVLYPWEDCVDVEGIL